MILSRKDKVVRFRIASKQFEKALDELELVGNKKTGLRAQVQGDFVRVCRLTVSASRPTEPGSAKRICDE